MVILRKQHQSPSTEILSNPVKTSNPSDFSRGSSHLVNKEDITKYALLSLALVILLVVLSVYLVSPKLSETNLLFQEEPLQKIPLALKGGETYRYLFEANISDLPVNTSFTYWVVSLQNCTGVYIQEARNYTPVCLNSAGNDAGGSNVTLGNPFIYFFRPWMLAVHDSWEWAAIAYFPLPSKNAPVSYADFTTLGKETVQGRSAYKVRGIFSSQGSEQEIIYWIDEEKRVLLREEGQGYTITLISSLS